MPANFKGLLADMDKLSPPDQESVERALRDLFEYGDMRKVSAYARIPYDSLTKQLNPENPSAESVVFEILMFLYGCAQHRPELEEAVWNLLVRFRPHRMSSVEAAVKNYEAMRVAREEGHATEEQVESAREYAAQVLASDGRGWREGVESSV
jgi:hypothetical protein